MNELINKIPVLILHNYVQTDAEGKTLHWERVVNYLHDVKGFYFSHCQLGSLVEMDRGELLKSLSPKENPAPHYAHQVVECYDHVKAHPESYEEIAMHAAEIWGEHVVPTNYDPNESVADAYNRAISELLNIAETRHNDHKGVFSLYTYNPVNVFSVDQLKKGLLCNTFDWETQWYEERNKITLHTDLLQRVGDMQNNWGGQILSTDSHDIMRVLDGFSLMQLEDDSFMIVPGRNVQTLRNHTDSVVQTIKNAAHPVHLPTLLEHLPIDPELKPLLPIILSHHPSLDLQGDNCCIKAENMNNYQRCAYYLRTHVGKWMTAKEISQALFNDGQVLPLSSWMKDRTDLFGRVQRVGLYYRYLPEVAVLTIDKNMDQIEFVKKVILPNLSLRFTRQEILTMINNSEYADVLPWRSVSVDLKMLGCTFNEKKGEYSNISKKQQKKK